MASRRSTILAAAGAAAILAAMICGAQARGGGVGGHGAGLGTITRGGFYAPVNGGAIRAGAFGRRGGAHAGYGAIGRGNTLTQGRGLYPSAPFGPFAAPYYPAGVAANTNDTAPPPVWMPPPYFGPPLFGEPGYRAHPVIYHIETATPRTGRSVRKTGHDGFGPPKPMVTIHRF